CGPASSSPPRASRPSTSPAARWPGSDRAATTSPVTSDGADGPEDDRRVSTAEPRVPPHRWVDQQTDLDEAVDTLVNEPVYAIDTEFHRERTYFPALALVQLAWDDELVLIDPLAVDVTVLRRLFESDAQAVFHAAQQDLDVLAHAVGAIPREFF